MSRGAGPARPAPVVLDGLEIQPDRAEVLRYLGYPAGVRAEPRVEARVEETLRSLPGRVRPRGMYVIYPVVRAGGQRLELAGGAVFYGRIGEFLAQARRAAVFLATAGPEIVELASAAMQARDTLGGLIYHGIGAALAEAVVEKIVQELSSQLQPGEALTLRYSPGYCGMALEQQRTLFGLLDASRIGVELLPSLVMRPVKSVSGLIGMGPADRVQAYGNPCDRCPLVDCRMRR